MMFGKLLAILLSCGLIASMLLVLRHRRLETAHDLGVAYREMVEHERALWELQAEIARRTRLDALRERLETMPGDWQTIPDPQRTTIDLDAIGRPESGLTLGAPGEETPGG